MVTFDPKLLDANLKINYQKMNFKQEQPKQNWVQITKNHMEDYKNKYIEDDTPYTADYPDEWIQRNYLGSFYYYLQIADRNATRENNSPWHNFQKYYYFLKPKLQKYLSEKFCHNKFYNNNLVKYDTETKELYKTLCINEYSTNAITHILNASFEVTYNILMILFSIRLTFDNQINYYKYQEFDWTKFKNAGIFRYHFKNSFAIIKLERILRRFQLFSKGIIFNNIDMNNQYKTQLEPVQDIYSPRLSESYSCESYFYLEKDKKIVRGAMAHYSADDILSILEDIIYLHDTGERIRYYDLFYLDRLESIVNKAYFIDTNWLDNHELQCFIAHMQNYFLKNDYEKYLPEYTNLEYVLQKFTFSYKAKRYQFMANELTEFYEQILSVMFSLNNIQFISKNIIIILIDGVSILMQVFYRIYYDDMSNITFYNRVLYSFKMLKFSFIRIVAYGNLYQLYQKYLIDGHPLKQMTLGIKTLLFVIDIVLFTMRNTYGTAKKYYLVSLGYSLAILIITITPGLFYFTVPLLICILMMVISIQSKGNSMKVYFYIDPVFGMKYSVKLSKVWELPKE